MDLKAIGRSSVMIFTTAMLFSVVVTATASPFVKTELLPYPVGWDSAAQAQSALTEVQILVWDGVSMAEGDAVLTAPIDGELSRLRDRIILENDRYRITYPVDANPVDDRQTVQQGEPIVQVAVSEEHPIVAFVVSETYGTPDNRFDENGGLSIKVSGQSSVFSVLSGRIAIPPEASPMGSHAMIPERSLIATYTGVQEYLVESGERVVGGSHIGYAGSGFNNNLLTLQFIVSDPIVPSIVFVEPKS